MLYYNACIRYIEKDKENYNDFIRIDEDNFSLYDIFKYDKELSIDVRLNQDIDNYIPLALVYIDKFIESSCDLYKDDSICIEVIISVTDNNSHNRGISYYKACEANNGDLSETDMTNLYNFMTSKLYFYNYNDGTIWKETSVFGEFYSTIVDIVPANVKLWHYKPKPGDIVTMKDYECHTLKSFQGLVVKCEDDKEFKKYGYKFDDIDIIALNHPHGDNYMNDTFIAGEIKSIDDYRPDLLKLANEFKIQELKEKFIKGE